MWRPQVKQKQFGEYAMRPSFEMAFVGSALARTSSHSALDLLLRQDNDAYHEPIRRRIMSSLVSMAEAVGALLKECNETVAIAESSTGGLISAALLAVPGASAYFVGGGVIYTQKAREVLLDINLEAHPGMRPST